MAFFGAERERKSSLLLLLTHLFNICCLFPFFMWGSAVIFRLQTRICCKMSDIRGLFQVADSRPEELGNSLSLCVWEVVVSGELRIKKAYY